MAFVNEDGYETTSECCLKLVSGINIEIKLTKAKNSEQHKSTEYCMRSVKS